MMVGLGVSKIGANFEVRTEANLTYAAGKFADKGSTCRAFALYTSPIMGLWCNCYVASICHVKAQDSYLPST